MIYMNKLYWRQVLVYRGEITIQIEHNNLLTGPETTKNLAQNDKPSIAMRTTGQLLELLIGRIR